MAGPAVAAAAPVREAEVDAFAEAIAAANSGDVVRARKCAAELMAMFEGLGPADPRGAEVLAYAAACHESATEFGAAVRVRELLVERYPQAPAARLALLALVRQFSVIAWFERAAAAMEAFTQRWPKDPETAGLLLEAATLRAGLGQDARALALLERAEQSLGPGDGERAAAIFWSRRQLVKQTGGEGEGLRDHAVAYLERHGARGGPGRRIVAEVAIAEFEWRRACKRGEGASGLCVTWRALEAPKGKARRCAGPVAETWTVHAREPRLAAAALTRLREVVKLGEILPPVEEPALRREVNEALDVAALIVADEDLEAGFLKGLRMPEDLSFFVEEVRRHASGARDRAIYAEQVRRREDSTRRFGEFWHKTVGAVQALERRYQGVLARKQSPRGLFTAAVRLAIVARAPVDVVLAAELPRELGSEMARRAYCGALEQSVAGGEASVRRALEYCVARAGELAYRDSSVAFCEAELSRRWPRAFPRLGELFGPHGVEAAPVPEPVAIQLELPEADL